MAELIKRPAKKLGVVSTIVRTHTFVFGQPLALAKTAAIPFIAILATVYAFELLLDVEIDSATYFVMILIQALLIIPFLTKWHRIILLGSDVETPSVRFEVGKREVKYFCYSLALYSVLAVNLAIVGIAAFAVDTLQPVASPIISGDALLYAALALGTGASFYIFSRFCFVLPTTAIGWANGPRVSWAQTAENGIRLTFVFIAVLLLWFVAYFFIEEAFNDMSGIFSSVIGALVLNVLDFCMSALMATASTLAYLELVASTNENGIDSRV